MPTTDYDSITTLAQVEKRALLLGGSEWHPHVKHTVANGMPEASPASRRSLASIVGAGTSSEKLHAAQEDHTKVSVCWSASDVPVLSV